MRKLGEVADAGPVTLMVYVAGVVTASKSSAYTFEKLPHEPSFAPMPALKTDVPEEFSTRNVAPVSVVDVIR
jgi:hypothetical protein